MTNSYLTIAQQELKNKISVTTQVSVLKTLSMSMKQINLRHKWNNSKMKYACPPTMQYIKASAKSVLKWEVFLP
jgi:hypothetical protein